MFNSNVTKTDLPNTSMLHARVGPTDFLDCYAVHAKSTPRRAADIITQFPGWAQVLLRIRRAITAPFGLINDAPDKGDHVGIFPVETEREEELIAGFNDKHLNFRVSVIAREGRIFLATWVHPHNIAGRLYLKTIMPFHIAISRSALARVAASV